MMVVVAVAVVKGLVVDIRVCVCGCAGLGCADWMLENW